MNNPERGTTKTPDQKTAADDVFELAKTASDVVKESRDHDNQAIDDFYENLTEKDNAAVRIAFDVGRQIKSFRALTNAKPDQLLIRGSFRIAKQISNGDTDTYDKISAPEKRLVESIWAKAEEIGDALELSDIEALIFSYHLFSRVEQEILAAEQTKETVESEPANTETKLETEKPENTELIGKLDRTINFNLPLIEAPEQTDDGLVISQKATDALLSISRSFQRIIPQLLPKRIDDQEALESGVFAIKDLSPSQYSETFIAQQYGDNADDIIFATRTVGSKPFFTFDELDTEDSQLIQNVWDPETEKVLSRKQANGGTADFEERGVFFESELHKTAYPDIHSLEDAVSQITESRPFMATIYIEKEDQRHITHGKGMDMHKPGDSDITTVSVFQKNEHIGELSVENDEEIYFRSADNDTAEPVKIKGGGE